MNELCDAADWFRPELARIIRDELQEVPRFHRKQWEHASIYRALEKRGLLEGGARGISFGSGTERLLYALARRVGHLWATDLYDPNAAWESARADDADAFVRSRAPFPYPEANLSAKRLDMRSVDFPEASFDFAYSACALEHIGRPEDFVRHLEEVRRVLVPGGVYVLTTEVTYSERAVEREGNYHFSRELLDEVVRRSGFDCAPELDARVTPHALNTPLPIELCGDGGGADVGFHEQLLGSLAHVQLSAASSAFTSGLLVLRKVPQAFSGFRFSGWDESQRFIQEGMSRVRGLLEGCELVLPPQSEPDGRTLFHSRYVPLGTQPRALRVVLELRPRGEATLELRVHKQSVTNRGSGVELEAALPVQVAGPHVERDLFIQPRPECTYAVLVEVRSGQPVLVGARVTAAPAGSPPRWPVIDLGPGARAGGRASLFNELGASDHGLLPSVLSTLYGAARDRLIRRLGGHPPPRA